MRLIPIALIAASAICPASGADDVTVAKARAKAALDLMQRHRERDTIAAAKAIATAALTKASKDRECMEDVTAAVERATKAGRLLFIWVGFDCNGEPHIRKAFPDAIHCHADEANGDKTERILAGDPKSGKMHRFDRVTFTPKTPAVIRQTIQTTPAPVVPQRVSYAAPVMRAVNC